MRRAFGRLAVAFCTILCVAGVVVTIGWFRLHQSGQPLRGTLSLPGLEAPVEVLLDSLGIPRVYAAGEADMLRSLGYLHAADRLWQMEFFRRIAAGRLSEVFGRDMLSTDRFLRTLDLWGAAERAAQTLDERDRRRLEAYAQGVNARLSTPQLPRPPEFALLRFRPEPWDVTASLAVGIVMNLDLSHWRRDLSRYWAAGHMPEDRTPYLSLGYPAWGPTILTDPVAAPPSVDTRPRGNGPRATGSVRGSVEAGGGTGGPDTWTAFALLESLSPRSASNAWVLGPARTARGLPILANDMHLALRAPSLWYLAALHADSDDYHAVGFTLPGIPGVVVGHNRAIAWGFTNGMVDDMDFAIEELSEDGTRYRDQGTWLELSVRPETVRVRRAEPEIVRVRQTRRGPLISDVLPGVDGDVSAIWVAARSEARTLGILDMNRAGDAGELDRALRSFAQPHQNVVFADTGGTIGYRLAGRIPLRAGWNGALPAAADSVRAGFEAYWPPDAHPAVVNPAPGFIVTANNLQAPRLGTAISTDYAAPLRAQRITQRLEARDDWTVESVAELQHDTYSLFAERLLPLARWTARAAGRSDVVLALDDWDLQVEPSSRGAPLFYAWAYRLRALIAADEYATGKGWAFFPLAAFLTVIEEGDESPWVDDVTTPERETLDDLAQIAWDDATAAVGDATWGELHAERHAHPLGRSPWLQRLIGFHVGPDPSPGAPHTVRPDDYRRWMRLDSASWAPPWLSEYGPSERFVARLEPDGPRGWFLIPTGQSGNPFSPHYRDLYPSWLSGGLVHIPLDRPRVGTRMYERVTLLPRPDAD